MSSHSAFPIGLVGHAVLRNVGRLNTDCAMRLKCSVIEEGMSLLLSDIEAVGMSLLSDIVVFVAFQGLVTFLSAVQ